MVEYTINDPHKLEVDHDRLPLTYHLSIPKIFNSSTIPVVVLHGFGEYSNSPYMCSLHHTITSKFNLMILSLNYVGTFTKVIDSHIKSIYPFLEQTLKLQSGNNKKVFLQLLEAILKNPLTMETILKEKKIIYSDTDLRLKLEQIEELKSIVLDDECNADFIIEQLNEIGFQSTFAYFDIDTKDDHQDYGLIQAIDVLTVIADIRSKKEYKDINWTKLSIVGTSHGGFIASMCDKLAPNTFATIVNNSGWIHPGDKFYEESVVSRYKNITVNLNENNYWVTDHNSDNYYSKNQQEIRSLDYLPHIEEQVLQTKNNKKQYFFIHAIDDHLIPIKQKDQYIQLLKKYKYDINYIRLVSIEQLDGKTFKSLSHGANASIKGLVIDFIVNNKNSNNINIKQNDFELKSIIKYSSTDLIYSINFNHLFPLLNISSYVRNK